MIKIRIGHQLLLLFILAFVSGCNDSDTIKFDKGVSGTGGSSQDEGNNSVHTPTPPNSTFAGLNSIGNKTDSTVTLYWTPHSDAVNYLIYDSTSGSPVQLQTISNPTANNVTLTGLTADANYKFIVRMQNSSNEIDSNTTELSVTMNHSPEAPTTPVFHTPATSPNTVNRPTLTVNGVKAGDIVKLYTDACSTEVASGTVGANQTSINLQVSNSLAANTYLFYANSTNSQGHSSSCTSSFLTYVLTFSFNGLTAATNKTDSTVTLNWSTHPNAASYFLYEVSSTPNLIQTISNPATNSVTLTGRTPDATYKYRLRMVHNQGVVDDNTNDLTVVMDHAPAAPNTPTHHTPNTDHGTIAKPTFTVSGVKAGDTVQLYQDDATCNSTAAASGTVGAGQTSINLQLTNNLTVEDQTYTFYADAINASGHHSNCTAGVDYEFQKPTCPDNYVPVLGNATIGTSDFCVAKYEMKCVNSSNGTQCSGNADSVTKVATSQPNFTPWVSIRADNSGGGGAWKACNDLNGVMSGTYALISNAEWMTIARDLQAVPSNWNGGVVGTNGIARGHSYGSAALVAAADTAPCTGTGQTCTDLTWNINKRTHKLSNDSVIWDLAGNVWEWVDWNPNGTSYSSATTGCSSSWNEFSTTCGLLSANQYLPSPLYTSTQNFGRWYGASGGAALRGGGWSNLSDAGVFALYLGLAPSDSYTSYGFRCVYRP